MIRMLWTRRPAGVDKGVVQKLLNVVNNLLFEDFRVINEHADTSSRLLHGELVTWPDGFIDVVAKKADKAAHGVLGNRPLFSATPANWRARRAVRHAMTNLNVTPAKQLMTD